MFEPTREASNMQPVVGFHRLQFHRCYTCAMLVYNNGTAQCLRPGGPNWDAGEREEDNHVCDRWRKRKVNNAVRGAAEPRTLDGLVGGRIGGDHV